MVSRGMNEMRDAVKFSSTWHLVIIRRLCVCGAAEEKYGTFLES